MPLPSPSRDTRRAALLDRMADHLLLHGLSDSSLRALGAAAGTSDRMLLYYFEDRDDLLGALLGHVAARLARDLDAITGRHPPNALLDLLWTAALTPAFRSSMLLFLELGAAAGRGREPQRSAAAAIARDFAGWVADRLDVAEADRAARAALLLATLDGLFLLHATGCEVEADAAARLVTGA